MAERTVTTKDSTTSDGVGAVRAETTTVETSADSKTTTVNAVWYVYGIIAFLLGMRFLLKLFGANPANGFVDFVYSISGLLSAPFDNIFGVTSAEAGTTQAVFEPSILVALAVYALIAWGIARALNLNESHQS